MDIKLMSTAALTIGPLSRKTGVHIETIRYYERIGLIPEPPRTAGGHRSYDEGHIKRLTLIARARELGFSLGEIRALLALGDGGDLSCDQMRAITLDHLATIRAKIDDLTRLEALLEDVSAKCKGGTTPDCPILETLYRNRH